MTLIDPFPARCPADDLELVIVAVPDDIATRVGESPHYIDMTGCRRPVHRVGVITLFASVDVETTPE